ncbi:MAG: 4Fe-4S binding protein [Candidatus Helarchaeota archaeon]
MGRPLWFVELLKRMYKKRMLMAKMTRLPLFGPLIDKLMFEGDALVCLPKDHVIQIDEAISPEQAVLPSQIAEYFINKAEFHWIMNFCICRESNKCKDYPREYGCLFLGEAAKGINPKLGRQVTKEEAINYLKKCRNAGLVHFIGKNKLDSIWLGVKPEEKLLTICSCCPCCCISGGLKYLIPQIADKYEKLPGVKVIVTEACVGCGTCEKVCFLDAIQVINNRAVINEAMCRACGRCVEKCPKNAIELTLTDDQFLSKTIEKIEQHVDLN